MEPIASIKHPTVVAARQALGQSGKGTASAFLVDGQQLAAQALESSLTLKQFFFLHPAPAAARKAAGELEEASRSRRVQRAHLTKGVFFKLLGLGYETSAWVMALVQRPPDDRPLAIEGEQDCLLIGERIRDPRNVGVLVRNADAFGLAGALFCGESADPYCRAAVRSTTGSILRTKVDVAGNLTKTLRELKEQGVRLIGSSAHAQTSCSEADLSGRCAIVVGNESDGLSPDLVKLCDTMVTIPMRGAANSLNVTVAAGIMLHEWTKQISNRLVK
jgi:tRNA G18 (ribose-2'-O)-methylase SpoU